MIPRLRRYSQLPGNPVSVTSLLSAVMPAPALVAWKIRTAAELAREFPDEPAEGLVDRHSTGAVRGSQVHKAIAAHLLGQELPLMELDAAQMWRTWWHWWEPRSYQALLVEQTVVGGWWAGTFDCLATDGAGRRVLFDWKTASALPEAPYPEHVAQLGAYSTEVECDDLLLAYISADQVTTFVVDQVDARKLWGACCTFALALWPELRPEEAVL